MIRVIKTLTKLLKGNKYNKPVIFNQARINTDRVFFELRYIKYGDEYKYFRIPKER